MLSKNQGGPPQVQIVSLEELVPQDHLLRKVDVAIDFSFIYDLVEDKYSPDNGRPSIDPVILFKIALIQYMFGIKSMRQTIKEIEVNLAYRWFLGLDFYDSVPHFTTFGKNYARRFAGTDLFEMIFKEILMQCMKKGVVDTSTIFVDSTHVKAHANNKKLKKISVAKKEAKYYTQKLNEEIDADRLAHGKKPLKDKDDHNDPDGGSGNGGEEQKEIKVSTTDPESGWFHKGEHKEEFAYEVESACDRHGWMLAYSVHPGNEHDAMTFPAVYEKIKSYEPDYLVMDAGYKTPAIAKMVVDDAINPIFPYKRPMTKRGVFYKKEYVYDEYYDCYICPNNAVLKYSTTNREGYREYKSDPKICISCPYLSQCTQSAKHQKVLQKHIWEPYMEYCEDLRHTEGMKELYDLRKETIERNFGTAKEFHGMRYTQMKGKEKMGMKVALTFTCMNIKKLARLLFPNGVTPPTNRLSEGYAFG